MGEKETASAEDARVLKTKTKSNQSNDRMDAGDGGDLDDDGGELDVSERATWTTSNPGIGRTTAALKPRDADQGFRTAQPGVEPPLDEAAINNTKSNIKSREGMLVDDDFQPPEIAIGDPGVNGNIAGDSQGIAVSDAGMPADKPTKTS